MDSECATESQETGLAPALAGAPRSPLGKSTKSVVSRYRTRDWKWEAQEHLRLLRPDTRQARCMRFRPYGSEAGIEVVQGAQRAFYKNVTACGSTWACPVCSERISHQRADELRALRDAHLRNQGKEFFVSITIPHVVSARLHLTLKQLTILDKKVKQDTAYKKLMKETGYLGAVTELETTYGRMNGWHPHKHQVLFCAASCPLSAEDIQARLAAIYARKLIGMGYPEQTVAHALAHQIKVTDAGQHLTEYVTKFGRMPRWDEMDELTMGQYKSGRGNHLTPWELLHLSMEGDKNAGDLFIEYAVNFEGKRRLTLTPGLRKKLGLPEDEHTDEEVAQTDQEPGRVICTIPYERWDDVCWAGLRGDVLRAAEQDGEAGVWREVDRARQVRREAIFAPPSVSP